MSFISYNKIYILCILYVYNIHILCMYIICMYNIYVCYVYICILYVYMISSLIFWDEYNLCTFMYIYVFHFISRCRLILGYWGQLCGVVTMRVQLE